ncbi:MAG: hypothetical protein AAF587_44400 [Bacteroidota bacterium]
MRAPEGEDVVDSLGYNPWKKQPSLYERRAKKNPDLPPNPPRVYRPITQSPSWKPCQDSSPKEVVMDGFVRNMQISYQMSKESFFKPTYKLFFTSGAVPACGSTATARADANGEIFLDLKESVDFIIANLVKTSPPLRDSLRSGEVSRIKANFYPCKSGPPHCRVYLNKQVPAGLFEIDTEQDVVVYPGAVSYDTMEKTLKVRLVVAPFHKVESRFFDPDIDDAVQLSSTELNQLIECFKSLYCHEPVKNFL